MAFDLGNTLGIGDLAPGASLSSFLMGSPGGQPIGKGKYYDKAQDLARSEVEAPYTPLTSSYLDPYLGGETGAESSRMSDELKRMGLTSGGFGSDFSKDLGGISSDAATRFNIGMEPMKRRAAQMRYATMLKWLRSQKPKGYSQPTPGLSSAIGTGAGMVIGGMYGGPGGAEAGGQVGGASGTPGGEGYAPIEY